MLLFYKRDHLTVDLGLSIGRARKRCVAAEILVIDGFHCDHIEIITHAVARYHSSGKLCRLLDIVGSARCDFSENYLFRRTIEVVIAGYQKKNVVLSEQERKVVSYHEIGHALVAAMQSHSAPVQKITIIPRTSGALGYTMQVEQGDKYLMTKQEIENKIATFTGGRAAEEVVFGEITTGASNDIEQATKLARAMITRYGMSDSFDMTAMETVTNQYLGGDTSLACSADTQKEIDRQVVEVIRTQHEKAKKILQENRTKLDELAQYLIEKETITGEEFMAILEKEAASSVFVVSSTVPSVSVTASLSKSFLISSAIS